jgi:hypothetical protein
MDTNLQWVVDQVSSSSMNKTLNARAMNSFAFDGALPVPQD